MDTLKREEGTNAMNVELRKLGASINSAATSGAPPCLMKDTLRAGQSGACGISEE